MSMCKPHPVIITRIPDIQGHRGCRGLMPENTVPAFVEAVNLGVSTLEMDVVMDKDGDLIVSHEPYFNHIFSTTPDGKNITKSDEKSHNIFSMTTAEVQMFDVGLKGNSKFPLQSKISCYKPTLQEVIDTIETYTQRSSKSQIKYNIEIKYDREQVGTFYPQDSVLVKKLLEVLEEKGITSKCIIQSFDPTILEICKAAKSDITIALLIDNHKNLDTNLKSLSFKPNVYSPRHTLVSKTLVASCHSQNIQVVPWTVNDEDDLLRLLDCDVDGIITDFPDKVIEISQGLLKNPE